MSSGNLTLPSVASKAVGREEPSQESRREDWRKAKELEEARKAGTAPALTDEEGKDINPHIPQYISSVPWYVGFGHPTLKHQRVQPEKVKVFSGIDDWYSRGVKKTGHVTKFQKGACTNCGATTHKKKDCIERPRKVGAKFTGEKIAPEEFLQPSFNFDYDGKRDRWNGYDPKEHEQVIQEFAKVEEAKKHLKVKKLYDEMMSGEVEPEDIKGEGSDREDDEDKYADDFDMPGTNFDSKRRITVRNLRIREDTAKYLYNLDINSAYYDPKTRSMRENPFKEGSNKAGEASFAGDNFVRSAGQTQEMAAAQLFSWDAERKGTDVHLQADPTKLELLQRQFVTKKEDFKKNQKESILSKYGGEEHLEAPPRELLLAQTENYVEYSKHGTVVKGQEKAKVKSRYEEDAYHSNHTSVWGSFWRDGRWGYVCCHSFVKMSYCTGVAGKVAAQEDLLPTAEPERAPTPEKSLMEQHKDKLEKEKERKIKKKKKSLKKQKAASKQQKKDKTAAKKKKSRNSSSSESSSEYSSSDSSESSSESEDEEAIRQKKIKEAMKKQAQQEREADRILAMDERKRPYNSMKAFESFKEPTEEEMEAFRMKRKRTEDPMADFLTR